MLITKVLNMAFLWKIILIILSICAFSYFFFFLYDLIRKKNKESFETRHPKTYSAIMFGLGLAVILTSIKLLKELVLLIGDGVQYLTNSFSNVDAVIVVALITGGFSIFSVITNSIVSKVIEYKNARRNYLAQKREEPYSLFIDIVYKILDDTKNPGSYSSKEKQEDMNEMSRKFTLYASKKVVNKWNEFRDNSNKDNAAELNMFVIEEIMNQMRKDMGVKKVKKGNLLGFFVNDIREVIKKK